MYQGTVYNGCNSNYKDLRTIPEVFHNLSRYNAHRFIKKLSIAYPECINLIFQTKEKYISFTKFNEGTDTYLRFIDSFKFVLSSLVKLSFHSEHHSVLPYIFDKHDDEDLRQP